MIFFEKVVIENFQSHVHTECTFHPGLNVFVGPSDSGKSAVLRALRWVLFNTPRGTDFIRAGSSLCKVELHLSDGTIITRVRNHSSINRYQLTKPNEEELVFEGFGSEVPYEITEAHQIRSLQLEQRDILLQMGHQLDGPFLLSESSGVKAKTIGLVSGAHLIDIALKKLNSDRNQLVTKSKFMKQQQQTIEQKLLPYQNLASLEKTLLLAEEKARQVKEKQSLLIRLKHLYRRYHQNKQEQLEQKKILEKYPYLNEAEYKRVALEFKLLKWNQYYGASIRYHDILMEQQAQYKIYEDTKEIYIAESALLEQSDKLYLSKRYKLLLEKYQLLVKEQAINKQIYRQTDNTSKSETTLSQVVTKKQLYQQLILQQRTWKQVKIAKQRELGILAKSSGLPQLIKEQLPMAESKLSHLLSLVKLYKDLMEKKERIIKGHKWIVDTKEQLRDLLMEYGTLLTEQGKCPTCGSDINDNLIEHLLHETWGGNDYAAAGRED